jgi:hypothetical protein
MSAIVNFFIKKDKVEFNEKGYANVTMFIDDETNEYDQNVSVVLTQSKEQREAKEPRVYVGNGRVAFVDGNVVVGTRSDKGVEASQQSTAGRETPDLPF